MAHQLHNTMCENTCLWRVSVCLGVTAVCEKFMSDVTDKALNLNFAIFDALRNGILVQNMTFIF